MKKILSWGFGLSIGLLILLTAAILYSPHFFIRHLLAGTLNDLRDSGILVSLVEPIPRKTVLHLSIPKIGVRDLTLEPHLRFSLPLSLEVEVEESLNDFLLLDTKFKTFSLKVTARQLLSQEKSLQFHLKGAPDFKEIDEIEVQGESKVFTNEVLQLIGQISLKHNKDFLKGAYDLNWELKNPYPEVNLGLHSNILESKLPLSLKLSTEGAVPFIVFDFKEVNHPSVLSQLAFDVGGKLTLSEKNELEASFTEKNSNLKGKLTGHYRKAKKDWHFKYAIPITFSEEFQLFHLFPSMKKKVAGWEGKVDLTGAIQIQNGTVKVTADVSIDELSGLVQETPFIRLTTHLGLQVYPSLVSLKPIDVQIEKLGEDLGLEAISLKATLTETKIHLSDARAKLKEGLLLVRPVSIPRETYEGSYWVTLENMDLDAFLRALKSDRLSGQGKMDGVLPFRYLNGRLFVDDARLFNQGLGKIQYVDPSIADVKEKIEYLADFNDLLSRGQQALAYKALSDFHYSSLELKASRTGEEHLSVTVHLKGKNPNLAKGQPFEINLPISGNLESFLIDSLLKSSM